MRDRLNAELGDRYRVERELGRGGMATVWLARDLRLGRPVAIKVLHQELAGAIGVDRFAREVRLTAGLQHPCIVPILDSGVLSASAREPALPWYAMPYIAGESLRERLARERQLPVEESLHIVEEIAGALQAAHRQGVIHRDIKPENVILADGRVYVVDFGIAKALVATGDARLTSTGLAIGTPAYMSPEQASADTLDARTDQYSLAVLLYEMLAGEPPFTGPTSQAIAARRLAEAARPVRPVRPTVPPGAEQALLKALERVPADRFPDVASFAKALRSTTATAARPGGLSWRGILVVGLVLIAALGAWGMRHGQNGGKVTPDSAVVSLTRSGKRGYERRTQEGTTEAIADFRAAIVRDSMYAPALTGLAKTLVRAIERDFSVGGISQDSMLRNAVMASDRALAADSGSAEAWETRALVSAIVDPTDSGPAIRAARRAIALDSTYAPAWHALARSLAESGDLDGAIAAWRRCVAVNPSYTQGLAFLALAHFWRRQYDSATAWADSAIAVDPNFLTGRQVAGWVAIERQDYARGAAAFEAARRLSTDVEIINALAGWTQVQGRAGRAPEASDTLRLADSLAGSLVPVPVHTAVYLAQAHAAIGDVSGAISWLTRYPEPRALHFQFHLRCDPPFDPIMDDPRFKALLTLQRPGKGRGC
jgi:tetratricopeptide (TPR) repeat protein/predicted Ser/Thr protein kinase